MDVGDKLETEELSSRLGISDLESRQCLPLHVGLAVLLADGGKPTSEAFLQAAKEVRIDLWRGANEAMTMLGDPPTWISPAEFSARSYAHDVLKAHHEKDYRCLTNFPVQALRERDLLVFRVTHWGRMAMDVVRSQWQATKPPAAVIIHRGHMRALKPKGHSHSMEQLWEAVVKAGKLVNDHETVGWGLLLDSVEAEAPLVPAKRTPCARCAEPTFNKAGAGHKHQP